MSSDKSNSSNPETDAKILGWVGMADAIRGVQDNERILDSCEENLKRAGDALHSVASTDLEFMRVRNEYGKAQLEKAFLRFKNDVNLYGQHAHASNLMLEFGNEIAAGLHINKGVKP